MVQDAQRNLDIKKYVSLQPNFLVKMDVWGKVRSSIIICRWLESHLKIGYDRENLLLVDYKSLLARLIMLKVHNEAHPVVDKYVQDSRNIAWIVRGCGFAKMIRYNYFK